MCLPARMIKKPHLVPEFNTDLPVYLDRSVVLTGICAPAIGEVPGGSACKVPLLQIQRLGTFTRCIPKYKGNK